MKKLIAGKLAERGKMVSYSRIPNLEKKKRFSTVILSGNFDIFLCLLGKKGIQFSLLTQIQNNFTRGLFVIFMSLGTSKTMVPKKFFCTFVRYILIHTNIDIA